MGGDLLYGTWDPKKKADSAIGSLIPKNMSTITTEMEKGTNGATANSFTCKFEMPLLKNAPKRLQTMTFEIVEEKFVQKVCGMKVEIPKAEWLEWKQHRIRFYRVANAAGGSGGEGEDDKQDDKDQKTEE